MLLQNSVHASALSELGFLFGTSDDEVSQYFLETAFFAGSVSHGAPCFAQPPAYLLALAFRTATHHKQAAPCTDRACWGGNVQELYNLVPNCSADNSTAVLKSVFNASLSSATYVGEVPVCTPIQSVPASSAADINSHLYCGFFQVRRVVALLNQVSPINCTFFLLRLSCNTTPGCCADWV